MSQDYAARVIFRRDVGFVGFVAGTGAGTDGRASVTEHGLYVGSLHVHPSKPNQLQAVLVWMDSAGTIIGTTPGDEILVPGNVWTRLTVSGGSPTGTKFAAVHWQDVAGSGHSGWKSGDTVDQDAAMLTVSNLLPYFDGATPDTLQFQYRWLGTVNSSESERSEQPDSNYNPLADPNCPAPPAAPAPPAIDDSCLEQVDEWRRYWTVLPAEEVSEWLDTILVMTVSTRLLEARQVRIRTWRNPDGLTPREFQPVAWEAEQIVSYLPPETTLTLDGVSQRAWAEVGGDRLSADALLYGTGGGPASWPVLSCGVPYLISVDVPLDAPDGNVAVDVATAERAY